MRDLLDKLTAIENTQESSVPELGDEIGFSFSPDLEIVTEVVGFTNDGIVVELDQTGFDHLTENGTLFFEGEIITEESKDSKDNPRWKGYELNQQLNDFPQAEEGVAEGLNEFAPNGFNSGGNSGGKSYKGPKAIAKAQMIKAYGPGTITFSKTSNGGYFIQHEDDFGDTYSHQYDPQTGKVDFSGVTRSSYYGEGVAEGLQINISRAVADEVLKNPEAKNIVSQYGHYTAEDFKKEFPSITDQEAKELANISGYVFLPAPGQDFMKGKLVNAILQLRQTPNQGVAEGNFHDMVNELSPETRKRYLMRAAPLNRGDPTPKRSKGINRALLGPRKAQEDPKEISYNENFNMGEAKYHGKEVPLGKKLPGDVKKSKVYVRKPNGKIVKVNFGDKKMRIKKSNPKRRKSFRARHNCKNPGPRWKARYWSCRSW